MLGFKKESKYIYIRNNNEYVYLLSTNFFV